MAESKVNRKNYVSVQGFMVRDLELKGNELLIYAIIYGFSQAENQVFGGSLQYLADWTNSTKQGVLRCLKSLIKKGYIQKNDKTLNGVKFCEYYITDLNTVLNKVEYPIKQSLSNGIKDSLPNNIGLDITEDTINQKNREKENPSLVLFEKIYSEYQLSDALVSKMREWLIYKHERKDDYAEQGLKSLLKKIKNKSKEFGDNAVCDLIDDCMANNWRGIIFERLKPQRNSKPQGRSKSYDVDSFFEASVARAWEEKESPKTVAEDESLRERAEALKEKLG